MGGGSSSASSNATNTQNTDKRLVVSDQAIGLSSDSSTVNITMADQGAIAGASKIALDALTSSNVNNAMVGAGFDKLMSGAASNDANFGKLIDASSMNNAMAGTSLDNLMRATSDNFKLLSDQAAASSAASASAASSAAASAASAITDANRQSGANYNSLLSSTDSALSGLFDLADKALTGGFNTVGSSLQAISAAADTANSKGTLDNRTITILGVSAAVAVAAYAMRK